MPELPTVFIGSSKEGKKYADALQLNLDGSCESEVWDQGVFGLSEFFLDSLLKKVKKSDFAILLLTADDQILIRGEEYASPRDNVLLELGIFLGQLGKERVFIVAESSAKIKIPSDLAGITIRTFTPPQRIGLQGALGPVSTLIKDKIGELSVINITNTNNEDFEVDLTIIKKYLIELGWEYISFVKLIENLDPKYTEEYIMKLVKQFPDQLRRAKVGGKAGIKILTNLLWKDQFIGNSEWILNYWNDGQYRSKTNRIENKRMIFEARPDQLENRNAEFGACIDIDQQIQEGKNYEITVKVRSSTGSTMGFQLWVHDAKNDSYGKRSPLKFRTPKEYFETIRLIYTATATNKLRIYLHCKGGNGRIEVSEVKLIAI